MDNRRPFRQRRNGCLQRMDFATIERAPLERARATGRYVVKTILSPRDEAIDLTKEEYEEALEATNKRRAASTTRSWRPCRTGPRYGGRAEKIPSARCFCSIPCHRDSKA